MAKLPVASDKLNMPADDVVETSIARVLDAEAAAIDAAELERGDRAVRATAQALTGGLPRSMRAALNARMRASARHMARVPTNSCGGAWR